MMILKNSKLLLGLVSMMMMTGCAKMPVYKSTWLQLTSPEKENNKNWYEGMCYDSESGIIYGLSNNQENLYIKMKFANSILQQKVMRTGLTVWIDTLGRKNKQLGLTFPVRSSSNNLQDANNRKPREDEVIRNTQIQIDTALFNSKYRAGMQTMELINYNGDGRVDFLDNKNEEGITATLRMDEEKMMYYEAEISLKKIFPNPKIFLNDTTQYFSFGIETGKIEMPSMGGGGGRPQMSGGGRPQMGGGGMRGGASPRGDSGMDSDKMAIMKAMGVESKIWVKKASLANINID